MERIPHHVERPAGRRCIPEVYLRAIEAVFRRAEVNLFDEMHKIDNVTWHYMTWYAAMHLPYSVCCRQLEVLAQGIAAELRKRCEEDPGNNVAEVMRDLRDDLFPSDMMANGAPDSLRYELLVTLYHAVLRHIRIDDIGTWSQPPIQTKRGPR